MKQKKIKLVVMLALVLCINSMPTIAFANQSTDSQEIKLIEKDKILIEDNWLNKEVAKQLKE